MQNAGITVLEAVTEPPPVLISKREIKAGLPAQLDHAVTVNRHPMRRAVFRLSAAVMAGFSRGAQSGAALPRSRRPRSSPRPPRAGPTSLQIDYFGRPAFLAQSPQFYKQIMVGVFERVFEVAPVFRAEPHDTTRHINEYVSLDVEFGFIENHFTVMALAARGAGAHL